MITIAECNRCREPQVPTLDEIKQDLFIALEILNGYTESEARLNYACVQGTCKCP